MIEAHREVLDKNKFPDWGKQNYTSGKLVSRHPRGYGFYEIRAKLPCGRGIWPAIWLLAPDGKWPDNGEIDIMEMVGWEPDVVHATLHSGLFNHMLKSQRGSEIKVPTACDTFHRYQLDWAPEKITIGIDDHAYLQVKKDKADNIGAWPYNRAFNMILNVAVGGDWGGVKGIDDTAFPQSMQIDYVRYWQKN